MTAKTGESVRDEDYDNWHLSAKEVFQIDGEDTRSKMAARTAAIKHVANLPLRFPFAALFC